MLAMLTRFHKENTVPQTETAETRQAGAWPAGVIARYLTVGGATVDLTGGEDHTYYRCTGCTYGRGASWWVERVARERAQGHAEKCRALPKP